MSRAMTAITAACAACHGIGGRRAAAIAAGLALALGIVLRLAWGTDIEWKGDEIWTFAQAHALCAGAPWPAIGMPTLSLIHI